MMKVCGGKDGMTVGTSVDAGALGNKGSQEEEDWNWTWRRNDWDWWWSWIGARREYGGSWYGDYWEWLGHKNSDRRCDVSLRNDGGRAVLSPTFNSFRRRRRRRRRGIHNPKNHNNRKNMKTENKEEEEDEGDEEEG